MWIHFCSFYLKEVDHLIPIQRIKGIVIDPVHFKKVYHRIPTQIVKEIVTILVHLKQVDHLNQRNCIDPVHLKESWSLWQSCSSQTSWSSGSDPNVKIVTQKAIFLLVFEEISSATFQLLAAYYLGKIFSNVLT